MPAVRSAKAPTPSAAVASQYRGRSARLAQIPNHTASKATGISV